MENVSKQYEVLKWASLFLEKNNREQRVAELLLQHHLGVSKNEYYMNMREIVPKDTIKKFQADIKRHVETGVPIQHITGKEMFYGREFHVNEDVLIPRPETEELVQHIIELAKSAPNKSKTIVDVGTGSGIIAITLALELPDVEVFATDISEKALTVAHKNASQLGANVTFLQGDFLQPFIEQQKRADVIVSNPPYIDRKDESLLSDTVKKFDPDLALFAEKNGLAAYKNIISQLPKAINQHAVVGFEIGHEQGEPVSLLVRDQFPTCTIKVLQDINGKDRMVVATDL
ncbi:release factor glutamine methyltransferase [Oceanobacillus limi]|uniref:Release factor glutamine methyltransferase n=1 Tax=Oceanobacillus limi TaxID=930131 RepID=A0A1I0G619_9BACI|nr:peptide chain release factor N(5)-glutamine methyltransferase [Oceanobacillus limi]SET66221.1 release factor glutamine methyltransferase [Oceanobacillus limi]